MMYLFSLLLVVACIGQEEPEYLPNTNDNEEEVPDSNGSNMDSLTYLALGDSYTIGESVDETKRWPVQLVDQLNKTGEAIKSPKIIARTGWTTDELIAAIATADLDDTYDLVSLLIGVNNQYRGYPMDQQKREFEQLLLQAIDFAGGDTSRVFVVSIPDWGVTPFAEGRDRELIAEQIDAYNLINYEICQTYNVQYFNITPISREAKNDLSLIAGDGLHPSGKMYSQWVELIQPWTKEILAQ